MRPGLGLSPASGPAVGRPLVVSDYYGEPLDVLLPRFGSRVNLQTFPQLGAFPGEVGPGNTPGGGGGINGPIWYGVNTPEARGMSGVNSSRIAAFGGVNSVYKYGRRSKKKVKYKFIKIKPSDKKDKKYVAVFENSNGRCKNIHFGAKGMSDYTKHRNDDRKKRYMDRHKKNENWDDLMSAGALSRWILWNKKTITASKKDYIKRLKQQGYEVAQ